MTDEVQVDMRRDVDGIFLEFERRVIDDIEVSGKGVTLRVNRYESQVNHRIAVQHDRIHDVVLVVGHGQR